MADNVLNKRVIYTDPVTGILSILVPTADCTSIERLIQDVPQGCVYEVVNETDIPTDRTYRNAWTFVEE